MLHMYLCIYVTVPANQLIIYDVSGHELSDIAGPMKEGSDLVLICEVRGGKNVLMFHIYLLVLYRVY